MALPSQTSRAETWRSSGSSGSSPLGALVALVRRHKPVFAAGLALAVAVGAWFYFRAGSGTPATVNGAQPPSDTFIPADQPPDVAAKPLGQAQPAPANISMRTLNEPALAPKPAPGASLDDLLAQSGTQTPPPATPVAPVVGGQPAAAVPPSPAAAMPSADPLNDPKSGFAPTSGGNVQGLVDQAAQLIQQNRPVEARTLLNDALMNPALGFESRSTLRAQIAKVNETLFFSPTAFKGDPLTDVHAVTSGETLGRIVRKEGLPIDWRLLVRINKMPSENALRIGQKLKIVRQPMHAVVHKNSYRMDVYAGPPGVSSSPGPDGQEAGWTYIRSFPVGLGESNGTPEGAFVVRVDSKLINPKWVNPRTGEVFQPDDAKNPIGEHWIGLEGVDENTRKFTGYGIHGTIDTDSIGQQKSMGCIRLAPADVEMVYELLIDRLSTVKIVP
ncbi:MAG: L,D-transpeptidase family protein [Phycisphaerales bacterium]|nr:L,D-transpeptidase family protein [Phycisphaerales bacterium]